MIAFKGYLFRRYLLQKNLWDIVTQVVKGGLPPFRKVGRRRGDATKASVVRGGLSWRCAAANHRQGRDSVGPAPVEDPV